MIGDDSHPPRLFTSNFTSPRVNGSASAIGGMGSGEGSDIAANCERVARCKKKRHVTAANHMYLMMIADIIFLYLSINVDIM